MSGPTPKQVREHYQRVWRLWDSLACALNRAHQAGVIVYGNYPDESPCKTNFETFDRFKKTTEKALAEAMRTELQVGRRPTYRRKRK